MIIRRAKENPILEPLYRHAWEAGAVFNGCPVQKGDKIYLLYRALSLPQYHPAVGTNIAISTIGIASSKDGIHFEERQQFITPQEEWERFGCEDPRVTWFDKKFYIFYTALSEYPFRAEGIRVGLAISKDLKTIDEKHLITPFNAKAMALFPEKIKNKIWAILTVHTDKPPAKICLASFDKIEELWSQTYWQTWYKNFQEYSLPLQRSPQDHIEVGAPPLKTKYGWLLLYSYIRNYFSSEKLFGVEAVLLSLENPLEIIGKIETAILVPHEYYERVGFVPNIVFPSGAFLKREWIYLYYGAADTTCCLAFIELPTLLLNLLPTKKRKIISLRRAKENPIITPCKDHPWESKAVFNPAAIYLEGKVHIIYRAVSEDDTSVLGYATSQDGIHIDYRCSEPIYIPRESFEKKCRPGVGSGCEDPRITKIGDKLYMCYTAYDGNIPRVALTWILVEDFLKRQWNWAKPVVISPPGVPDKNAFIFPEKVKGKYMIVHRLGLDIDYSLCETLDFKGERWLEEQRWIYTRKGRWDSQKVGAAAPPIKTKEGWIMFYHGLSEDNVYRVGVVLLDIKDARNILSRPIEPILEPETPCEKEGLVPNVVFPCGNVVIGDTIFVYYGGADKTVNVATIAIDKLLKLLDFYRWD